MRLGTAWPAINGLDMVSRRRCTFVDLVISVETGPIPLSQKDRLQVMELENELRVFGCKVHALASIHLQLQPVALRRPRVTALARLA